MFSDVFQKFEIEFTNLEIEKNIILDMFLQESVLFAFHSLV
jgi:hypothetical protein